MASKILLRVWRQNGGDGESHWDEFEIPLTENLNVISALMEVRKNPLTTEGREVEPPAWDAACLEEVCGSCTMNVNGMVRQACTALIEEVGELEGETLVVKLEPMRKYPLVRDLQVDRSKMFENLIKVKAWVPIDGSSIPAADVKVRATPCFSAQARALSASRSAMATSSTSGMRIQAS